MIVRACDCFDAEALTKYISRPTLKTRSGIRFVDNPKGPLDRLTATALVAFVGDLNRFRSGRDLAAYLGLTPREHSSGQIRRLGHITKRGNSYVRMMLIHGARSALRAGSMAEVPDDLRTWALSIARRRGFNVAAVALANKLARVCWRVWHDQRPEIRLQSTSGHHPSPCNHW